MRLFNIILENDELLVINKPAGLVYLAISPWPKTG